MKSTHIGDMDQEEESLSVLFDKALNLHNDILDSQEDSNSEPFQDKVKKGILMLEDATRLAMLFTLRFEQTHSSSVRSVVNMLRKRGGDRES